jgi:hypothetical protein
MTPELARKGLGLLHLEPHLASQCRAELGGDEVCPRDPCRTDEGRAAGSATVHRSQLSATNYQRNRRAVKLPEEEGNSKHEQTAVDAGVPVMNSRVGDMMKAPLTRQGGEIQSVGLPLKIGIQRNNSCSNL